MGTHNGLNDITAHAVHKQRSTPLNEREHTCKTPLGKPKMQSAGQMACMKCKKEREQHAAPTLHAPVWVPLQGARQLAGNTANHLRECSQCLTALTVTKPPALLWNTPAFHPVCHASAPKTLSQKCTMRKWPTATKSRRQLAACRPQNGVTELLAQPTGNTLDHERFKRATAH